MRLNRLVLLLCFCSGLCLAQSSQPKSPNDDTSGPATAPKGGVSLDVSSMDLAVDPCVDFYQYACGNWRKNNPIPADKVRWAQFDVLRERNDYLLYLDLKAAADSPKTPLQRKYGDYFAACMNAPLADQLGAKPIEPEFADIAALTDKNQLA